MFLEKSIGILILNILCREKAISTMYIAHISTKTELLLAFIQFELQILYSVNKKLAKN